MHFVRQSHALLQREKTTTSTRYTAQIFLYQSGRKIIQNVVSLCTTSCEEITELHLQAWLQKCSLDTWILPLLGNCVIHFYSKRYRKQIDDFAMVLCIKNSRAKSFIQQLPHALKATHMKSELFG